MKTIDEKLDKMEVLVDIYNELARRDYTSKSDIETAKLKMELVKKELLLLSYLLNKEIEIMK